VEGSAVEVVEVVVDLVVEPVAALQAVADPEVLLLLVVPVGLVVRAVQQVDPLDQMNHRLSLTGLVVVQVPVLAFWGDLSWAGFLGQTLDLPLLDIVGGVVVTVDWTLLVETAPWTGWKIPLCQTGRSGTRSVVVSPSGNTPAGQGEGFSSETVIGCVQRRLPSLRRFPRVPQLRSLPWHFVVVVDTV
jgi:hypothetical protein